MADTNRISIAETNAWKARTAGVVIVDEVTGQRAVLQRKPRPRMTTPLPNLSATVVSSK
jgi:hypothetical protein